MITSSDLAKSFTDEQKERSFYRMQNMTKWRKYGWTKLVNSL